MSLSSISKRKFLAVSAAGICTSIAASPVWAHRAARTETEITFHSDGRIDIIHLMHTDDTKRALYESGIIEKPDLLSLKARAQAALYVEDNFAIYAGEKPIYMEIIGAEIEGPNFYVYQQGLTDAPVKDLSIEAAMLREFISTQTNSVNVKIGTLTQSLDFTGRDGRKKILP